MVEQPLNQIAVSGKQCANTAPATVATSASQRRKCGFSHFRQPRTRAKAIPFARSGNNRNATIISIVRPTGSHDPVVMLMSTAGRDRQREEGWMQEAFLHIPPQVDHGAACRACPASGDSCVGSHRVPVSCYPETPFSRAVAQPSSGLSIRGVSPGQGERNKVDLGCQASGTLVMTAKHCVKCQIGTTSPTWKRQADGLARAR